MKVMKYALGLIYTMLFCSSFILAQNSDDNWEELSERLAAKAERIAEQAARQAERTATKWEVAAERYAEAAERQWNRKWKPRIERFPGKMADNCCPDAVFLGIESSGLSDEKARKLGITNLYGSYVTKVIEGSAAQEAGLLPFDYIYGVNDQRTSDNQDLADIIEDFKPGEEVTLHIVRQGSVQALSVKLRSYDEQDWNWDEEDGQRAFLGVSPAEAENEDEMDGATIEIVGNTTAEAMGLQDGDIIKAINGNAVLDWEDVEIAIANLKPGQEVTVVYERNGQKSSATMPIKSYEEAYPLPSSDNEMAWDGGGWNDDWDEQDEAGEDKAFLGVYIERISEEKAKKLGFDNPYGSYITGILKNTGAEKAGLKPFDYIYGIDEYRVGERQSLGGILTKYKPGNSATVHFIRKGKKSTTELTFGKSSEAQRTSRNSCEDPFFGINQGYGDDDGTASGVKISPVKNATASEMGLQAGDRILSINGYPMLDWTDISTAINMLTPGETITVEYLRDGKTIKATKPIKSYAETKKCADCNCGNNEISLNMDDNFNWSDDMGSIWTRKEADEKTSPKVDVSKARVALENVPASDENNLKSKGVELPSSNNLQVERLSLAANASMGMFELKFNLPSSGNTVVKVFNASGRTIYEYDLGKFSGEFSDYVDLAQNGTGSYYLHVNQGGKIFAKKIVLDNN
jgi:S1-C subfamily serine protease